jgi:hypothetical protein
MLPASAARTSTTDHLALAQETLDPAAVWKGHFRMIWKNRGKLTSSWRRPIDCQRPLAQYCSNHRDKNLSWA